MMKKENRISEDRLKRLLMADTKEIRNMLTIELETLGRTVIKKNDFIFSPDEKSRVLLVAHYDTVLNAPPSEIHEKPVIGGKIMTAEYGIGGDDRCGIELILSYISRHPANVLFTDKEEIGGIGAGHFATWYKNMEAAGLAEMFDYIIEADRRGEQDVVFYDCTNTDFINDILLGQDYWRYNIGSFSDISIIASVLDTAAVNISAGYDNEHMYEESINTAQMQTILMRMTQMIGRLPQKHYDYGNAYGIWNTRNDEDFFENGFFESSDEDEEDA